MVHLQGEEKRRYVGALFHRIAPRYDLMNTLMTAGQHHRWRRRAAAVAAQGPAGPALDVACGTGDLALALARRPGLAPVVGVDLVPRMAALAQEKVRRRGLAGRVALAVGDALSLPFPSDTFACVASAFVLRNVPDLRRALEEQVRVLRPGGRLVALEITPLDERPWRPLFRLYFHRLVPLLGRLVAGEQAAYAYLPRSVDLFPRAEALGRLLEGCGLVDVGWRLLGLGTVALHWGTRA